MITLVDFTFFMLVLRMHLLDSEYKVEEMSMYAVPSFNHHSPV